MVAVYLRVLDEQDGTAAVWFVAALALGAVGASYGSVRSAPHRRAVLVAAGLVLGVAGLLGILSIGLPVVLAGGLCLVGAIRSSPGSRRP